ncbi:glucose-induced degradation protein 8 [Monosporozyma servazzii]
MTNNNSTIDQDSTKFTPKYKHKSFYKDEWLQRCKIDKSLINTCLDNNNNNHEKALPILLLNYFVVYGYEEAAIKMAMELNIVSNNQQIVFFNNLYMIKQRNKIKNFILTGQINNAISLIDQLFGLNTLKNNHLYFNLILLNLIEMIRNNNNSYNISTVIQYTRKYLAPKASQSKQYMQDLQSVISLLMLTTASSSSSSNKPLDIKSLPRNLQNLYSIKLRNKLAHSINMKLLQIINANVSNQHTFPNLILSQNDSILSSSPNNNTSLNNLLKNYKQADNTTTPTNNHSNDQNENIITDHNKYWQETKKYLNLNSNNNNNNSQVAEGNCPFEAKLVQIMKLWIYSENELHSKGYGIPRVEDNLTF